MKPKITWILIADGARARIVANDGPNKGVRQVDGADFRAEHPASGELTSDRPGRTFDSAGDARHAMEPGTDPHREAKKAFATDVAAYLHGEAMNKSYDRLIIFAPAKSLGDLRSAMSDPVCSLISAEKAKDLTHVPNDQLSRHLSDVLAV